MGVNDKHYLGLIDSGRFASSRAQQVLAALELGESEFAVLPGNARCHSFLRQGLVHVFRAVTACVNENFYHYVLCGFSSGPGDLSANAGNSLISQLNQHISAVWNVAIFGIFASAVSNISDAEDAESYNPNSFLPDGHPSYFARFADP